MSQYRPTVSVTNGSPTVTIAGVDATAEIDTGDWFGVNGTGIVSYQVASTPTYGGGNTTVTLTTNYAGTTNASATGIFQRDFTTDGYPILTRNDLEALSLMGRFAQQVQTGFNTIDGGTF